MSRDRDLVRGLYRFLLGLYPAAFRRRFNADLLQAFDDRRTEPRFTGTVGGIRLVAFLLRYTELNRCSLILEGIETEAQLHYWQARGVHLFQGYWFHR